MSHNTATLLTALPYPLLTSSAPERTQQAHWRPPSTHSSVTLPNTTVDQTLDNLCTEELIDLSTVKVSPEEQPPLALELGLEQVHGTIYCEQGTSITPRHRALAIRMQHPEIFTIFDGRISRDTASWVWGFTDAVEVIHIDFSRFRRANVSYLQRKGVIAHQVNFHLYDDLTFNGARCATPLRTVAEMLLYNETASEQVVPYILAEKKYGCSSAKVLQYLKRTPYLKHKNIALERLKAAIQSSRNITPYL